VLLSLARGLGDEMDWHAAPAAAAAPLKTSHHTTATHAWYRKAAKVSCFFSEPMAKSQRFLRFWPGRHALPRLSTGGVTITAVEEKGKKALYMSVIERDEYIRRTLF
jgi:hypothetical protein